MEKIIYIPVFILFLLGMIFLGFTHTNRPVASLNYEVNGADEGVVFSGLEYTIHIDFDEAGHKKKDDLIRQIFWDIQGPKNTRQNKYNLAPVVSFPYPGKYVIDAYGFNGRRIANDTLDVAEMQYIDFELAAESITEGEDAVATNKSTFKNLEYEWAVLTDMGNELFLDRNESLIVSSLLPGEYEVQLRYFKDGDTIVTKRDLVVNKKHVPVAAPKPVSKPKPVAASPPVPKPIPKVVERPLEGWYRASGGTSQFELGPVVPEKNTENFSGGTLILELSPKSDIHLSEFSFWGNHKTGNYSILYECTTCTDENMQRLAPFVYRTGNDFYQPQVRKLDSRRVGFKAGHTYKITLITQEDTQMQFEKLAKAKYENAHLKLEFLTDRSPIFGLTFKTK